MPTKDQVTESLRAVIDPELRRDIVELEMVRSIEIHANGLVDVMVSLTTAGCPIRSHFQTGVAQAVRGRGEVRIRGTPEIGLVTARDDPDLERRAGGERRERELWPLHRHRPQ